MILTARKQSYKSKQLLTHWGNFAKINLFFNGKNDQNLVQKFDFWRNSKKFKISKLPKFQNFKIFQKNCTILSKTPQCGSLTRLYKIFRTRMWFSEHARNIMSQKSQKLVSRCSKFSWKWWKSINNLLPFFIKRQRLSVIDQFQAPARLVLAH